MVYSTILLKTNASLKRGQQYTNVVPGPWSSMKSLVVHKAGGGSLLEIVVSLLPRDAQFVSDCLPTRDRESKVSST